MNKTHRLIWSTARNAWIVAHEAAATHGKPSSPKRRLIGALAGALIAQAAFAAPPSGTLPTGGQVVAGQASISQAGNAMTIQQGSDKAILNWQSFNIGSQASVHFQQPSASAIALNRVLGADASAIYGSLTANGQVFLINPSGVLFGPGAKVDVGGMVASTLNLRNEDFLAGNYRFSADARTGGIANAGELHGKYIALLAPEVRNEGIIAARLGTSALAAGGAVTLDIAGDQLMRVRVEKADFDTLVENKRLVQADEGTVILSAQSADDLLGRVINTGIIEARGISTDGGTVRLLASGSIDHSGSIDVSATKVGAGGTAILLANLDNPQSVTTVSGSITAKAGSDAGNGGFIETSGTQLNIKDTVRIDTSAAKGKTGQWLLDPVNITIGTSGNVSATTLSTALGSSDVTVATTPTNCSNITCPPDASDAGDITVASEITWSSAHALTLSADQSIFINAPINVTGSGTLNLKFDQAGAFSGNYFISAPVNLSGLNSFGFTVKAGSSPVETYTVLTTQATLMGMTTNDNNVRYVLGNNVTTSGAWTPIGPDGTHPFMGVFDGLGHTISGITVSNTADYQGMFGMTGATALVQNIGVTNVNVSGTRFVGALVGANLGAVYRAHATGTVTASTATSTAITAVGGLVGLNDGVIDTSRSAVNVTATSDTSSGPANTYTGGSSDGGIGGLAGISNGSVKDSYATGSVSGLRDVGGLIGWADMNVETSYATGTVTLVGNGSDRINAGGLIGAAGSNLAAGTSFWDKGTSSLTTSAGGVGKTTSEMTTAATFSAWDTSVWKIQGGSYPVFLYDSNGNVSVVYVRLTSGSSIYGDTPSLAWNYYDAGGNTVSISPTGTASWLYNSSPITVSATTNAGTYGLTYDTGLSLSGYSFSSGAAVNWVVSQRPVTITPNSGQSKVYGNTNPTYTYTAQSGTNGSGAGLLSGHNLSLSGALSRTTGETVAGGPYAFTSGDLATGNSNYTITLASGPSVPTFAITQRPITLTATPVSKNAGESDPALAVTASASGAGIGLATTANGNTVNDTLAEITGTLGREAGETARSYDIALGSGGNAGTKAGNYAITFATDNNAFTIGQPNGIWDAGGASNKLWSLPANWTNDTLPTTGSNVTIGSGNAVTYDINSLTLAALTSASPITFLAGKQLTLTGAGSFTQPLTFEAGSLLTAQSTLFLSTHPTFGTGAKIDISSAGTGVLSVGGNPYTVIRDLANLRTMAGSVAIGADIDAAATQTSGSRFVAKNVSNLAGLGHTISGLTGNGFIQSLSGMVRDIGMVNVNIQADANSHVGGLANRTFIGATIHNSYVTGSVSGNFVVGGLVGTVFDSSSTISNSYTTAAVTGDQNVGGLVGSNSATISNSYATGAVIGTGSSVGGLAGESDNSISNSYATGSVTGRDYTGGLVGNTRGAVSNSYATGSVTGSVSYTGGLVGQASGAVSNSYATGSVTGGSSSTGGLVGLASDAVSNSYATGSVTGSVRTGGLVGDTSGAVSNSYATGSVNGNADGVVVGRGTGGTRLTAAQSVVQASYSGWDFTNTWAIDAGSTTPYLQGLPKPASVKANVLTPTQQNNVQNAVSNSLSSSTNTIMYKNAFDRGTFTQPSDARNTFNTAMSQAIGLSTRLLATDECGPGGAGCSSSSVRPSDQ